ncbi:PPE domain-containing protein [Actinokineospora sp. HUAS TT18]|uniref:PPE domain-containing protein n=1 Tax=Actinokineospora sp. HUAS TT18 TaxID=3447451 RepID=UPI003F5275B2
MAGDNGLSDLRFEGYSHNDLAAELDRLRQGPGSESLHRAVNALKTISEGLAETDRVLREELLKIGVYWEGEAADGGTEATKNSTVYAQDAGQTVDQSAGGVQEQGETFSNTRNSAPDGSDLRGPTKLSGVDRFMGTVFGHTTDHAKDVQQTNAAHQQAVSSMNGYSAGSQSALNNYQSLPVPPGMSLETTPYQPNGTTSAQHYGGNPSTFTPSGSSGPGVPGQTSVPPGGGGGQNYTGLPGGQQSHLPGTGGNQPGLPGRVTGVAPVAPGLGGLPQTGGFPGGLRPGFPGPLMGDIAAVAGLAGSGGAGAAAGSSLEKDRVVRGGGFPDTPEGRAARAAARGGTPIGALPDDEDRAARNAERHGARPGRAAGSLMQPAAAGAGAPGEDDDEHVRKYGIDSDDVFGDDRLVIPPVLGQDD